MRKVERLVNLIALLLDTRRPLTLDQVAELVPGYEASGESLRRMFERDKDELRDLGIPLLTSFEDPLFEDEVGYRIRRDEAELPDLALTREEAAVLGLAAMRRLLDRVPAGRRMGYRLLLAGMVALALGWAAAVRP